DRGIVVDGQKGFSGSRIGGTRRVVEVDWAIGRTAMCRCRAIQSRMSKQKSVGATRGLTYLPKESAPGRANASCWGWCRPFVARATRPGFEPGQREPKSLPGYFTNILASMSL